MASNISNYINKAQAQVRSQNKKFESLAKLSSDKIQNQLASTIKTIERQQAKYLKDLSFTTEDSSKIRKEATIFALMWLVKYAQENGTYQDRTHQLRQTIHWEMDNDNNNGRVLAPMRYAGFVESDLNPRISSGFWVLSGALIAGRSELRPLLLTKLNPSILEYTTEKGTPFNLQFSLQGVTFGSPSRIKRAKVFRGI